MSKMALIREADLKRMANVVRETGVVIEVDVAGTKLRIMPVEAANDGRPAEVYQAGVNYGRIEL